MASESPSAIEGRTAAPDPRAGLVAYAAALYTAPGVAAACLEAQDRHTADVSLLLLACWLGARGTVLDPPAAARLRALAARWHDPVVARLRRVRRALKPIVARLSAHPEGAGLAALRAELAAVEIEVERRLAELLEVAARNLPACGPGDDAAVRANLVALQGPAVAACPAVARLVDAAFRR